MPRIELSDDEALVLLDWLWRHGEAEDLSLDAAVQRILWNLESALEPCVTELLSPEYEAAVLSARERLTSS